MSSATARVYGVVVSSTRWSWAAPAMPAPAPGELSAPDLVGAHGGREKAVDVLVVVLATALGALFLSPELHDNPDPWSPAQIGIDVSGGVLASAVLWWRRRWPAGVAVVCLVAGVVSSSATPAGLLALSSLAVHRPARQAVLVGLLWVPALLLFAAYSPTTGPAAVVAFVMPLVLAASGWGMFLRARRQLLLSLRERALRAEADQELHQEQARVAERTRIAREMHDVLAHRISLLALHAGGLEVRPDLPPAEIRQTAALLRSTASQALEELRSVIGVLRDDKGYGIEDLTPQPTLHDLPRLVEEAGNAGMDVELHLRVEDVEVVPAPLGRDAYRIVQEALTNISKHGGGAPARVRVTGSPGEGLHISVRNEERGAASSDEPLPGAGAGLLGLRERVALTGGTLLLGPDGSGDFVVEADLTWRS
jgi:signal transduction histidine kinase